MLQKAGPICGFAGQISSWWLTLRWCSCQSTRPQLYNLGHRYQTNQQHRSAIKQHDQPARRPTRSCSWCWDQRQRCVCSGSGTAACSRAAFMVQQYHCQAGQVRRHWQYSASCGHICQHCSLLGRCSLEHSVVLGYASRPCYGFCGMQLLSPASLNHHTKSKEQNILCC